MDQNSHLVESNMSENVKQNIIQVAQETFMKFGYRKTTMDEIAVAAGKGKSSLYYYFKSKEEVFQAVVEKEAKFLIENIKCEVQLHEDPKEQIRQYIITRISGVIKLKTLSKAVRDTYLSNLDFIEEIRIAFDNQEIAIVSGILQNGVKLKVFRQLDIPLTARTFSTIMKGLEIPIFIRKNEFEMIKNIDEILEILFKGINH